ncbi:organic solute transporter Ostalpha-domain-containing protein [Lactarius sanguifluus]|nr:organic solute transporter Ostalpha-domain-containing protein [Lactarius sanguifluus]
MSCPSDNIQAVDQSKFWSDGDIHWDAHRVGWAIAGGCSALTVIISSISVFNHCRNYTNRAEQRQILRILYMPPVYAVVSFFSYRYFRSYTYYSLSEIIYEAITLSAFLLLLIEYVASTAAGHSTEGALARKDKGTLPIPFCCWRYRPTKPYFMYALKWSVMQYVVIRPAVSIAGIICEAFHVLCASGSYSVHYADVYLESVDFISISIALYGLILFYGLTKDELAGRRPLAKFLSIKLIVMFTFYQSFVFNALKDRVIHGTDFWTPTNIADGLNALAICIEMIFFSAFMMWAFPWKEYLVQPGQPHTSIWRPLWDSINLWDFAVEIWSELSYFGRRLTGRRALPPTKPGFGEAFGVAGYTPAGGQSRGGAYKLPAARMSYDDDIRLTPYTASHSRGPSASPERDIDKPETGDIESPSKVL